MDGASVVGKRGSLSTFAAEKPGAVKAGPARGLKEGQARADATA